MLRWENNVKQIFQPVRSCGWSDTQHTRRSTVWADLPHQFWRMIFSTAAYQRSFWTREIVKSKEKNIILNALDKRARSQLDSFVLLNICFYFPFLCIALWRVNCTEKNKRTCMLSLEWMKINKWEIIGKMPFFQWNVQILMFINFLMLITLLNWVLATWAALAIPDIYWKTWKLESTIHVSRFQITGEQEWHPMDTKDYLSLKWLAMLAATFRRTNLILYLSYQKCHRHFHSRRFARRISDVPLVIMRIIRDECARHLFRSDHSLVRSDLSSYIEWSNG